MRKPFRLGGIVLAGLVLAASGCVRRDAATEETLRRQDQRIGELEGAVKALETELAAVRSTTSTNLWDTTTARLDPQMVRRVDAAAGSRIDAAVQKAFDQKIGTREDVEAIFDAAMQKAIARIESLQKGGGQGTQGQWSERMQQIRSSRTESEIDRLAEDLRLSAAQKEQVRATRESAQKEMRDTLIGVHGEQSPDPKGIRDAMDAVRARQDAQMKTILSSAQYERYEKRPQSAVSYWSAPSGAADGNAQGQAMTAVGSVNQPETPPTTRRQP